MATKLTENHVKQILEELIQEYNIEGDNSPYDEYISALMVVKITKCEPNVPKEEKDDYCILCWLTKSLPLNLSLTQGLYKGVKVFGEVIGEVGSALCSILKTQ